MLVSWEGRGLGTINRFARIEAWQVAQRWLDRLLCVLLKSLTAGLMRRCRPQSAAWAIEPYLHAARETFGKAVLRLVSVAPPPVGHGTPQVQQ
jgi:hypothetical protein